MVRHELDSGSEYASPQELSEAYGAAAAWLEHNGEFFVEPVDEIHGEIDGVPISELPPSVQYKITGEVLKRIVPKAAEILQVGNTLELRHNLEYWAYAGEGKIPVFQEPSVQFGIYKDDSSVYTTEDLMITFNSLGILDDEKWKSRRVHELKGFSGSGLLASTAISEASSEYLYDDNPFDRLNVAEEEAGIHNITRNKCAALLSIAEHLDEIQALQSRPAN